MALPALELIAGLFQQEELADAHLVLQLQSTEEAAPSSPTAGAASPGRQRSPKRRKAEAAAATELTRFPAHRLVLCGSAYFKAQVQRWTEDASSSSGSGRPAVTLTLERPEQQAAATAVLGAMYGVRGALAQLEHAQLVDAVLLADMLQVPGVVQQAVDALKAAASSEGGLSAAALAALGGLAGWPSCLAAVLPSAAGAWCRTAPPNGDAAAVLAAPGASAMQRVLLAALGDLERVWADEQLKDQLLALPLPAMQLLLASDELQVASEDTVLYTAARYVRKQPEQEQRAAARQRLAVLVRAPQLSRFALAGAALAVDAESRLLQGQLPGLKQLVLLHPLQPSPADIQRQLPDAPAAWHLGPRRITPLPDSVQALWRLLVAELAAACRRCAEERKLVSLFSPTYTLPLGGLAWQLKVACCWEAEGDGGCDVGVYCVPVDAPPGVFYKLDFSITAGDVDRRGNSPAITTPSGRGWRDFFRAGTMRGGWDAAAWAAKGWPAEGGAIELRLTVHKVL